MPDSASPPALYWPRSYWMIACIVKWGVSIGSVGRRKNNIRGSSVLRSYVAGLTQLFYWQDDHPLSPGNMLSMAVNVLETEVSLLLATC